MSSVIKKKKKAFPLLRFVKDQITEYPAILGGYILP